MKFSLKINALLLAVMALVMVACSEDTTAPTTDPPNAPTGLMAKSVNATSVGLKWTAPTGVVVPTGYVVKYNEVGSSTAQEKSVTATSTTATIDGLTNGKVYDFVVIALNDTVRSTASTKVSWAPAARGTSVYKLYSSKSNTFGSGLHVTGLGGATPSVKKIAEGDSWDICFDDKFNAADPRVGSPGQSAYVDDNYQFPNGKDAKTVYISNKMYSSINSIDEIYESEALTLPSTGGEVMLSLNTVGGTTGFGFVSGTKQPDGTYVFAKYVVKRVGGNFVQGSGNDTFIEVEVSYQTMSNVPYALIRYFEQLPERAPVRNTK